MRPMTVKELAAELKLTPSSVHGRLLSWKVKPIAIELLEDMPELEGKNIYRSKLYDGDVVLPKLARRKTKLTDDQREQIVREYGKVKLISLARRLGVHHSTVRAEAGRLGLASPIRRGFSSAEIALLAPVVGVLGELDTLERKAKDELSRLAELTGRSANALRIKARRLAAHNSHQKEENHGRLERPADSGTGGGGDDYPVRGGEETAGGD